MNKIKIYKNTKTLDKYIQNLTIVQNKKDAEVLLMGGKSINLNEYPNLKGIFKVGIGVDNIPFEELKKRKIKICLPSKKTQEYIYEEVANFTCNLILHMMYDDVGCFKCWLKKERDFLKNKKLLIIGMGNIGKKVFYKMKHFMKIDSFDIIKNSIRELNNKISVANIISLHIPLMRENQNFWNKKKLSCMKRDAILINTSRGAIVNEDDLYNEICNSNIKAAFDTFWNEPYNGKLLKFYPNKFYATPHVASISKEFLQNMFEDFKIFLYEN